MSEMIEISADRPIEAYIAKPTGETKGGVIVIHEVWGLADHIKSIADRFATEGYLALAPNLLFEVDFSSVDVAELQKQLFDPKTRSEVQPKLRKLMAPLQDPSFGSKTVERLKACFNYLYDLPECHQNIVVNGFCFGGSYSFALAVSEARLKLALPFYGQADQTADQLKSIKCPVRAFYGQNDEDLIIGLEDLIRRMSEAKVDFKSKVYENCGHAFFNDTNPFTYNRLAADDAWNKVRNELAGLAS